MVIVIVVAIATILIVARLIGTFAILRSSSLGLRVGSVVEIPCLVVLLCDARLSDARSLAFLFVRVHNRLVL